jgi:hypothetical protein
LPFFGIRGLDVSLYSRILGIVAAVDFNQELSGVVIVEANPDSAKKKPPCGGFCFNVGWDDQAILNAD